MIVFPDVYFGRVGGQQIDWRTISINDDFDNDELLDISPEDVVGILGFDPAKESSNE